MRLAEIRATGMDFPETEAATPAVAPGEPMPSGKPLPTGPAFTAAIDLYQGRKYLEAQAAFAEITQRPKVERETGLLAAFYEMECLRKLGDLDGLAKALGKLVGDPALGGHRLRQLEIDAVWDVVRTKSWDRVEQLAKQQLHQHLPGDQRAQVAYCHGLALENRTKPLEALNAYNIAMTADAGASEELARQAALGVLRIHLADPEVQAALTGPPEVIRESPGFPRLKEAAAVAAMFELTLGAGTPLPSEFAVFLKHHGGL